MERPIVVPAEWAVTWGKRESTFTCTTGWVSGRPGHWLWGTWQLSPHLTFESARGYIRGTDYSETPQAALELVLAFVVEDALKREGL